MNKKFFVVGLLLGVVLFGSAVVWYTQREDAADAPSEENTMAADVDIAKQWDENHKAIDALIDNNQMDKAIGLLKGYLDKNPSFWPAAVRLTECYLKNNDGAKAEESIRSAEAMVSDEPYVLRTHAAVCVQKKEYDNAKRYLQRSLELAKDDNEKGRTYANFASLYYEMQNDKEAKDYIDKALKVFPQDSWYIRLAQMINERAAGKK